MSKGKIWPEFWIDCLKCDHHEPLAESDKTKAIETAIQQGWRANPQGKWVCPKCVEQTAE